MMKNLKNVIIIGLAAGILGSAAVEAADWPQWGGNTLGRNMYAAGAVGLPDKVEPGDFKQGTEDVDLSTAKNVKWAAKLGTQSYGNPTISNGRIFIGTNNDSMRDPKHPGDRSILLCLDEKSGEFLWQLVIPKLKSGKVNDWESLGLLSSPTVVGNRVYVVSSRCEVLCLDVEGLANGNDGPYREEAVYVHLDTGKPPASLGPKDGDIIWRYDMMDELGVFPHNASNCSVIVVGDMLYACTSNGQDWTHSNVPSPLSPSFIALDAKTGELKGDDDAGIGPNIYHGQWSSPSYGSVNGQGQLFFGGGDGWCYAFNPKPVYDKDEDLDFLNKVWWYDANPPEYKKDKDGKEIKYPAAEGPSEINATPVFYNGRVYIATGQDPEHGEGVGQLVCLDPTKTGDITKSGTIWSYKGIKRTISTVSIDPTNGLLFIGDFSGFVHCLDADTGKVYWVYDMKAHMWGSTLAADGKVYVGDEDGDFVVLASDKKMKVLSETYFPAPIYSTPVVANGVLYVATQSHIYALYDEGRAKSATDQPKAK